MAGSFCGLNNKPESDQKEQEGKSKSKIQKTNLSEEEIKDLNWPSGLDNLGNTCFANAALTLIFESKLALSFLSRQKASDYPLSQNFNDVALLKEREAVFKSLHKLYNERRDNKKDLKPALNLFYDELEKLLMKKYGHEKIGGKDGTKIRRDQGDEREFVDLILDILGYPYDFQFSYNIFDSGSIKIFPAKNALIQIELGNLEKDKDYDLKNIFKDWLNAKERIDKDNAVYNNAGIKEASNRFNGLSEPLPDDIFINLQRYTFDEKNGYKPIRLSTKISLIKILEVITKSKTNPLNKSLEKTHEYHLKAIAIQRGSLQAGHYYAYRYDENQKKWGLYNDSHVSLVSEEEVFKDAKENAYVLLYSKSI